MGLVVAVLAVIGWLTVGVFFLRTRLPGRLRAASLVAAGLMGIVGASRPDASTSQQVALVLLFSGLMLWIPAYHYWDGSVRASVRRAVSRGR